MKRLWVIFLLVLPLLVACSKEPEKAVAPISAEKSTFEEMKERTAKNPKDIEAWVHLADLYDRDGQYQDEIAALTTVIAIDPGRASAYLNLGNAYSRVGRYADAIGMFEKARRLTPKNPVLYNNLGVAYGKTGNIDKEIAALEKAISLRNRYATARFNLGVAFLRKGRRDRAMMQYHEIKKFDEGIAESLKKEIDAKGSAK